MAIASVQQAAFGDHNIQYQFRTENNGGQVRQGCVSPGAGVGWQVEGRAEGRTRGLGGTPT